MQELRRLATPPWTRPLAILLTCVTAKVALVLLRGVEAPSPWLPIALLAPDAALTLIWLLGEAVLAGLARLLPKARAAIQGLAWLAYGAAVLWIAVNVPVARVFSTPLTRRMLATVGGALSDSIGTQATPEHIAAVGAVLLVGALAPLALARLSRRFAVVLLACVGLLAGLGLLVPQRTTTLGLHRNALITLAETTLAQFVAPPPARPLPPLPPVAPGPRPEALDLSHLAGAAKDLDVIVVVLESTGAKALQPWGNPQPDATPNLTKLAAHGVLFDRYYAAYPESIKGLWAVLCGSSPAAHTSAEQYAANLLPCTPLPGPFARAGYRTALLHSGRFVYLGMADVVNARGFDLLADAGTIGGPHVSSFGTADTSTVQALLTWLDTLGTQRYFAMYMPIAGHHPYNTPGDGPRPFAQRTEQDAYRNDLFEGDAALGQLIEGLRQRGRLQRTVWLVLGDHGEAFYEHPGNFAHTLFVWEENVHVPLLLVVPGATEPALHVPQVASAIDVLPTLLDLAGLPLPETEGRSLLRGGAGVARFFTDHGVWQRGLRQGPWKCIEEVDGGRVRLYQLERDPGELQDVAEREPARAQACAAQLKAWSDAKRGAVLRR